MGPAHGGFGFLKGSSPGIEGYAVGRMTKSRRGKLYIDDVGWGPEADSIKYGYRALGRIHVFIGKIGESEPEPNISTDLIESPRRVQPAQAQLGRKHVFVGFMQGMELAEVSKSEGETAIYSGDESSTGETESIYQLQDGGLGGYSNGNRISHP